MFLYFLILYFKTEMKTTYAKANAKAWKCFYFHFLKMLKLYYAPKMHETWVYLDLIKYIK